MFVPVKRLAGKIVSKMTCNMSSGTLNLCQLNSNQLSCGQTKSTLSIPDVLLCCLMCSGDNILWRTRAACWDAVLDQVDCVLFRHLAYFGWHSTNVSWLLLRQVMFVCHILNFSFFVLHAYSYMRLQYAKFTYLLMSEGVESTLNWVHLLTCGAVFC